MQTADAPRKKYANKVLIYNHDWNSDTVIWFMFENICLFVKLIYLFFYFYFFILPI